MTEKMREARRKARELVSRMDLAEKVAQITQYNNGEEQPTAYCAEGRSGNCGMGSFIGIRDTEEALRRQTGVVSDNPHGVAAILANDVIHGHRTTFPVPLAQSCSWDPEVARKCCEAAAREAYNAGTRWTFAPMVDIARDPRWGRIVEGYGEDTLLCSDFAAASVRGYQGDSPDDLSKPGHILACMKHFAAYGAAIGGRDYNSADMSLQTLFDVYLPPFKAGIDAGAATVMSAYQDVNGVPASGSHFLLTEVLRKCWGFEGFVISDYDAVPELVKHGYAEDLEEAVEKAFNAGVDVVMCGNMYNDCIPKLVAEGRISEEDVTRSAETVVMYKYLLGLMDAPLDYNEDTSLYFSPAQRAIAREAAAKCSVLLENNGILPINPEDYRGKRIAVVGPLADTAEQLLGAWSAWCDPSKGISILEAVKERFEGIAEVVFARGCELDGDDASGIDEAVSLAAGADLVICVVGENRHWSGEGASMSNIGLKGCQTQLVRALGETTTPMVTLLACGRPMPVPELRETSDAVLCIWYGGTEGAHAAVDVLTNAVDPSGRLSVTFPYSQGQIPLYYNHLTTGHKPVEGEPFGTRYNDVQVAPLYPFGYGLGYTSFEYSDLRFSCDHMKTDGEIEVRVTVTNTGEYDGHDVVQLYVHDVAASRCRPEKELKAYKKVFVHAGESVEVVLTLRAQSLAFTNERLESVVEPGRFTVWVAHNSADEKLSGEIFVD